MSDPTKKPLSKMLTALAARALRGTRFDSIVNVVTGFGTSMDKSTYAQILPDRDLTDWELSALYHSQSMAARVVDIVPQEMLREPFSVETGDATLDEAIYDKFESIDVRGVFADGIRWGRCFGGGAVLIGADDGRSADQPLNLDRVKDLDYLHAFDRRLLWPVSHYEEPGAKYGKVEKYAVTEFGGVTYNMTTVHESRLILFGGEPTGIEEKRARMGWDLSVLQRVYDVIRQYVTSWQAIDTMLVEGAQPIFKMTGLSEAILSGNEEALRKRLAIVALYKSVMRAMVIDADLKEEFIRQTANFANIPELTDKFMIRLAGEVQIPVTILMGQSPAGMNATGESDYRHFYDRIRSLQTKNLTGPIRRLVEVWLRSKASPVRGKTLPKSIAVNFIPLWGETPAERATRQQAIATRDAAYIQAQVLLPDEVALARFRPGGFDDEIRLTPEGIKAREKALKADLDKIESGEADQPPPGGAPGGGPPQFGGGPPKPPQLPPAGGGGGETGDEQANARNDRARLDNKGSKGQLARVLALAGGDAKRLKALGDLCWRLLPIERRSAVLRETRTDASKMPRMFELVRNVDETGISGTGVVALGMVFPDGAVSMRWQTKHRSNTQFESLDELLEIHGHEGKTVVRFVDETSPAKLDAGDDEYERDTGGRFAPKGGGVTGSDPKDVAAFKASKVEREHAINAIATAHDIKPEVVHSLDKLVKSGALKPGVSTAEHVAIAQNLLDAHNAEKNAEIDKLKSLAPKSADVKGRTKKLDSVLGKLERKPKYGTAEKLQDMTGLRVVANDLEGVKSTVAEIEKNYKVIEKDDYVANPKEGSGYRSVHLIVESPNGLQKEIQVRTRDMDKHADWAHDAYKPQTPGQEKYLSSAANRDAVQKYSEAAANHYQAKAEGRTDTRMPDPPPGMAEHFGVLTD
jgi:phage-related protein (TIGR01555 family)